MRRWGAREGPRVGPRRRDGRRSRALSTRALRIAALLLLAGGCARFSDISGPSPVGSVVSTIELSAVAVTVGVGSTAALQATPRDATGRPITDRQVIWSSSDTTVARISAVGVLTALDTGRVQIAASADGRSAVAQVTVVPRSVASLEIGPLAPRVLVGGFVQLVALPRDETGAPLADRPVFWSSSDPTIANVDATGFVSGLKQGVVTINAVSESREAALGVTVEPVPVVSVTVAPALDTLVVGQSTQFTAVARDSVTLPLVDRPVSWQSSTPTVATVSATGLVIAQAPGTVTISAVTGGVTGVATLVVQPRPVGAIIISPDQLSLTIGQSAPLAVQITDDAGNLLSGRPLTFVSTSPGVATVTATGVVQGVAVGTTTVTVTSEGRTGTMRVTVLPTPVASLRVTPATASVQAGTQFPLQAVPLDANGVALPQRPVTWRSGAPTVLSVSATGVVRALSPGTGLVFATVDGRLATASITVERPPVSVVAVTPAAALLTLDGTLDLAAVPRDARGAAILNLPVTWSSTNPLVAVVSSTGRVRALGLGETQITARVDTVVGVSTITIVPVPVASVVVSLAAATLPVGETTQATATVRDAQNNVLEGRAVSWRSTAPAVATVSATGVVTAEGGGNADIIATVEGIPGTATLRATQVPTSLAIQTQPAGAVSGRPFTTQPVVRILDRDGAVVTTGAGATQAVTVARASGTATLGGTITVNAVNGVATFTNLSFAGAGTGAHTLTFTSGTPALSVTSASLTVTAGTATNIAATTTVNQSAVAGTAVSTPPRARVTDAGGNPVSGVAVTFTVTAGGGSTTPASGSTVNTNANGVAILGSWTLGGTAGTNTVTAAVAGLTGSPVAFNATGLVGSATRLGITREPAGAESGDVFTTQPVVEIRDATGNRVTSATTPVTVSIATGNGTLVGTTTVNAVAGVATFTNLRLDGTGAHTLLFSATGFVGATSGSFTVTQVPTSLVMQTQPAGATSGSAFGTQPSVRILDQAGLLVTTGSGASLAVTAVRASGSATLGGTATVTAVDGVATFTNLSFSGAGTGAHTLRFSTTAPALTVTSATVTVTAGAAARLAGNSTLSQSAAAGSAVPTDPSVRVTDAGGNPVSGVAVRFTVTGGGGGTVPASGSTVSTNASGVATLTSWTLGATAGANTLTAAVTGLTGSPVTFTATGTAGAPAALVITAQPAGAVSGSALTTQPVVEIRDANGNRVTNSSLAVTAARAAGSATLGGTVTVSAVNGIATFTNLSLGGAGTGAHTLTFSTSTPALSVTSASFTVTAGAPAALAAVSTLSQSAAAGTAVSAPPSVRVSDAGGNPVSGVAVTFAVASGGGSTSPASGGTVSTNASGLATLSSWTLGTTAGANSVTATVAGLTGSPVTFNATGTAGAPAQLALTTQPAGAVSGSAFTTQPVVEIRDANGNRVTTASLAVTATRVTGSATLGGTVTVTAVSGIATFTNLSLGGLGTGSHTLSFTTTSPALSITSASFPVAAGAASAIAAASAVTQSAVAGTAVSAPPSVRVTDAGGNPVSGAVVTFTVAGGGGSTSPASGGTVSTNASGLATLTSWTLGSTAGANSVTATAAGLTGSPVTFNATGTAGAATTIAAVSVTTQSAVAGSAVSAPPSARVTDASGNPVSGVSVTFAVASGGGSTSPASGSSVSTNASGLATLTSWTLGSTAGANRVTATAAGLTGSPVTFNATGTAGAAANITAVSATTQSTVAGSAVAAPPSVRVTDASGNPVSGVSVTFAVASGGGSTSPASGASVSTNASGLATLASWTLGSTAGANSVTATASGLTGSPVTFNATGTAGAATTIAAVSTTTQSAPVGAAVSAPPSVRVTDVNGNPVSGVAVTFTVVSGGGTTSPASGASVSTNASGLATLASWTLGTAAGTNSVTASAAGLTGSPVTFNATGTAGAAANITAVSVTTQSAVAGSAVAAPPSVRVTDASGNPVSGVSVTFTVTAGGGATSPASGATITTNASGLATLTSWTLGTAVGANSVTAVSAGLTGSPLTFNATGAAGAATSVSAVSVTTQSAPSGSAVGAPPSVRVADANGNPVSGVSVTFAVASGGGSTVPASGASVSTNASGLATLTSWTLGATAGANSVTATAAGLTGSPLTFNATGTVGAPTQLVITTQPAGAVSGAAFTTQPVLELRDVNGNRVTTSSLAVTAARASGSATLGGTLTVNAVNGVATFTNLSFGGLGTGVHTLQFTTASPALSATSGTVTVTAGVASEIAAVSAITQSAVAGGAVSAPPSVRVTDAGGNPVSGVSVTFAVASGGGSTSPASGSSVSTNASGLATLTSWTLGAAAGANSVTATAAGLTGSPVTFNATGTAGAPTSITAVSTVTQSAPAGGAVGAPPSVRVTDAGGNPVSGVSVTFTLASGGGSTVPASGSSVSTNASGLATLTSWTLGTTAGANSVTATAAGLTGSPVTFNATGTVGAPTQLVLTTPPSSTVTSGAVFPAQPVLELRDVNGNRVTTSSLAVTAARASGSATLGGTPHGDRRERRGHIHQPLLRRPGHGRAHDRIHDRVAGAVRYVRHDHGEHRCREHHCRGLDHDAERAGRNGRWRAAQCAGDRRRWQPGERRVGDVCRGERRRQHGSGEWWEREHERKRPGHAHLMDARHHGRREQRDRVGGRARWQPGDVQRDGHGGRAHAAGARHAAVEHGDQWRRLRRPAGARAARRERQRGDDLDARRDCRACDRQRHPRRYGHGQRRERRGHVHELVVWRARYGRAHDRVHDRVAGAVRYVRCDHRERRRCEHDLGSLGDHAKRPGRDGGHCPAERARH